MCLGVFGQHVFVCRMAVDQQQSKRQRDRATASIGLYSLISIVYISVVQLAVCQMPSLFHGRDLLQVTPRAIACKGTHLV